MRYIQVRWPLTAGRSIVTLATAIWSVTSCLPSASADDWCLTQMPDNAVATCVYPYPHTLRRATLRIFVHRVHESNGTGGLTQSQVDDMLSGTAAIYAPRGVFFEKLGQDEINDSSLVTGFTGCTSPPASEHSDAIDMYLVAPDLVNPSNNKGKSCYSDGGTTVWIRHSAAVVLAHEIGHSLGLAHTNGGTCIDPPGGAQCATCGDYVCDTPPDPGLSCENPPANTIDPYTCAWTVTSPAHPLWTTWGAYNPPPGPPDTHNIMSTRLSCLNCETEITAGQADRILCNLEADSRYVPELASSGVIAAFVNQSATVAFDYTGNPYDSRGLDYDADGDLDLFVTDTGGQGGLMQDQRQQNAALPQFHDVRLTAFASSDQPSHLRRLAVGDLDNDGKVDVFASARGVSSPPRLYRNVYSGGQGLVFDDLANNVGGIGVDWATYANDSWTGAFGDYNRDGLVDLYIGRGNTDGAGKPSTPLPDQLLRNKGNGLFDVATSSSGLDLVPNVTTTVALWADIDGDNDIDLFRGDHGGLGSQVVQNRGDGTFNASPSPLYWKSVTGAACMDVDGDGKLDLIVVQDDPLLPGPIVALGDGNGSFPGGPILPNPGSIPLGGPHCCKKIWAQRDVRN
jgi:hypothetical protein